MNSKRRMPSIMSILGPEDSGKEGGPKEGSDLHEVMKEFIEAVKSGDVDAAVSAFKACSACADEGEEPKEG